jgi:hypothetical protein
MTLTSTSLRSPQPATRSPGSGRWHHRTASAGRGTRLAARFRSDLATSQWWWSPELFALHGIPADSVQPSVGLLLSHVHTDDRPVLREALGTAGTAGIPFTLEYRVLRMDGEQRTALVVCEPQTADTGTVTALAGLVVDVTGDHTAVVPDEQVHRLQTEVEQLRSAMASRAAIEQAKGILMLLMSCGDQVAFDLLAHISSHTHRKVRDVAVAIIDSAAGQRPLPDDVREILHDACPPARSGTV